METPSLIIEFGHWQLAPGLVLTEASFGFIYLITNTINNRKYIGKKQCISKRRKKPLKGKKRKRITYSDSDWREYTGSSNELNADIAKLGKDKFRFEIIKIGSSKSELSYEETKLQFDNEVLFKDEFYNSIIHCRLGKIKR